VDLVIAILAMEHGVVPPTVNLGQPAENGLLYIGKEPRQHKINKALIISRGRGGINSALVVEKE
jgi:3-oxoacyl-(acyl-carrier-protein) synthase